MDYNKNINHLLDKYWKAETSLEEENWLMENVPNLENTHKDSEISAYFDALNASRNVQSNTSFDELMNVIQKQELEALGNQFSSNGVAKSRSMYKWISSAAAVLLVGGASYFMMNPSTSNDLAQANTETNDKWADKELIYNSPEEAYAEVRQALLLVSNTISETADNAAGKLSKAEPYTDLFK